MPIPGPELTVTVATISGRMFLPDGVAPMPGTWYAKVYSTTGYAVDGDGEVVRDGVKQATDTGVEPGAEMSLPVGWYQFLYQSDGTHHGQRVTRGWYVFHLTGDTTWGEVMDTPTLLPVTPDEVAEAVAARDEAVAAAAGVQREQDGGVAGLDGDGKLYEGRLPQRLSEDGLTAALEELGGDLYSRRATFHVESFGAVPGTDCTAAINATVTAAEMFAKRAVIEFGQGVYQYQGSWSLSGKSFSIKGVPSGKVGDGGPVRGTVIRAINQTGPVIDFTGYQWPGDYIGRVVFEGFTVEGDGTPGAAKAGLANTSGFIIGAAFRDINVRNTGGPGVAFRRAYLNEFTNIVVETPVDPQGDQVPYFDLKACNGNRWSGCGVRSIRASNDCWAGGAWRITDNGVFPSEQDRFDSCWAEFLHVPTDGTLVHVGANRSILDGWQSWDCLKETGATGTSHVRYVDSGVNNYGGNEFRGLVRGAETGTMDCGIDMQQSNNYVQGVKGFNGSNVKLAAGVGYTTAILAGRVSGATGAAFVDNSGQSTNVLIDNTAAVETHHTYRTRPKSSGGGGAGVQVEDPATPANGAVWLGDQGARIQAISKNAYLSADAIFFRNTALGSVGFYLGAATDPRVAVGTGSPEGVVTAAVGSTYHRKDGGAGTSFYVKESGTGNVGWVAK